MPEPAMPETKEHALIQQAVTSAVAWSAGKPTTVIKMWTSAKRNHAKTKERARTLLAAMLAAAQWDGRDSIVDEGKCPWLP